MKNSCCILALYFLWWRTNCDFFFHRKNIFIVDNHLLLRFINTDLTRSQIVYNVMIVQCSIGILRGSWCRHGTRLLCITILFDNGISTENSIANLMYAFNIARVWSRCPTPLQVLLVDLDIFFRYWLLHNILFSHTSCILDICRCIHVHMYIWFTATTLLKN